jgi:hypothetical protein
MRKTVDAIVIACMFVAVYINWTDFPKQTYTLQGRLVKTSLGE